MIQRFLLLIFALVASQGMVAAQISGEININNPSPMLGEIFQLTLRVDVPVEGEILWPNFIGQWGAIEVLRVIESTEENFGATTRYQWVLEVVTWVVGEVILPEWGIAYTIIGGDDTRYSVEFSTLSVTVPSILAEDTPLDSLRPLKPLLEMDYFPTKVVISIGAGLLAGIILIIYQRFRRTSPKPPVEHAFPTEVMSHLDLLQPANQNPVEVYSTIGDVLRRYIGIRFAVDTTDCTTSELIQRVAQRTEGDVVRLRKLLEYIELVRFAGVIPAPETTAAVIKSAKRWIVDTDRRHIAI
jgi:hypothetical protein